MTRPASVDPRGQRFSAALTAAVLAVALLLPAPAAVALVAWQTVVFAVGVVVGPHATPYALLFRRLVRPRLAPPAELEDLAPARFAQAVGLLFAGSALVLLAVGATLAGQVAAGLALTAALLNAGLGLCLGCELYLLLLRLVPRTGGSAPVTTPPAPPHTRPSAHNDGAGPVPVALERLSP